ncbi:VOC family protein [Nocardia sp. CA-084685]|uniref:VOC family protein n=1 Tax=Nocardia sp. CA-084685 TaxID=3239970 RepID=UPI003D96C890
MDWKIELVAIPVTDVDRAKDFYTKIGFNADHDHRVNESLRFVQLTPPGSGCSICLGEGITEAAPGSVEGMQMVVPSAEAAYQQLVAAGVEASPVKDMGWGLFTFFTDPDGNKWAVQELPKRG